MSYSSQDQSVLRSNHQYLSAAWIDYAHEMGTTAIGASAKRVPYDLVPDLMDICVHHTSRPILECPSNLAGGGLGRKRLIAAILRFADELDIDGNRVEISAVTNFNIDPENALFWWLHHQTKVTFAPPNVFSLNIRLNETDYREFAAIVESKYFRRFQLKNLETLTILQDFGFPIHLSADGGVRSFPTAKPLPEPVRNVLRSMDSNNKPSHSKTAETQPQQVPPTDKSEDARILVAASSMSPDEKSVFLDLYTKYTGLHDKKRKGQFFALFLAYIKKDVKLLNESCLFVFEFESLLRAFLERTAIDIFGEDKKAAYSRLLDTITTHYNADRFDSKNPEESVRIFLSRTALRDLIRCLVILCRTHPEYRTYVTQVFGEDLTAKERILHSLSNMRNALAHGALFHPDCVNTMHHWASNTQIVLDVAPIYFKLLDWKGISENTD